MQSRLSSWAFVGGVVTIFGGCCGGGKTDRASSSVPVSQPPVAIAVSKDGLTHGAGERTGLMASKPGERMLLAYVSPSRHQAWATKAVITEAKAFVKHDVKWVEVSDNELAALPTKVSPVLGDMHWWDNAECATGVMTCVDDCVFINANVYRHATTFNSTACVVGSGRCWDNLQVRCVVRFYSDSSCSSEIPNTVGAYYDWICGSP